MRLLRFARNDKEGGDVTNQTDEYSYLIRGIVWLTINNRLPFALLVAVPQSSFDLGVKVIG